MQYGPLPTTVLFLPGHAATILMDHGTLLKTLLLEMKDGVIACDPQGRILLFNEAAANLFGRRQTLCTGQSLYSYCFQPPVQHALSLLQYQHESVDRSGTLPYVQFLNAGINKERYFRCRISLLPPLAKTSNSFVIICEDISAWYSSENPLSMKIEEFRAPMTNLRAAVENLTEYPDMSPVMRSAFENVLVQESLNLTETFNALARSCDVLLQAQSHLTELSTTVLFGYVAHHLRSSAIAVTATPAQSIKVRVDIYGLLLVLDHLVGKITRKTKKKNLSCVVHTGEQFIYLDFVWPGEAMATGAAKAILADMLHHSLGEMTVAATLRAMEADLWSQQQENGKNSLRLALPVAAEAGGPDRRGSVHVSG